MKIGGPLQCRQCGSNHLKRENGGYVCCYCGTVHDDGRPAAILHAAMAYLRRHRIIALCAGSILVLGAAFSIAFIAGRNTVGADRDPDGADRPRGMVSAQGSDSIEPEKKVGAEFRNVSALPDGIGNIYFVGMLANTGETPIYAKAEIALFDGKGRKVAVARGYGIRGHLHPGETTPVEVLVSNAPAYASFQHIGHPEIPSYYQERPEMSISDLNMKRPETSIARHRVNGTVKNRSGEKARYVQIAAVVFDGSGTIIGYGSGFLGQTVLAADEESPFSVEIHLMRGSPARYLVEYDASPVR